MEREQLDPSFFEQTSVTAEAHVAVLGGFDPDFLTELNLRLAKAASEALRTEYDFIFVKIDRAQDLARIGEAAAHLKSDGTLWVCYPKDGGAQPTDAQVRAAGIAAGLIDRERTDCGASYAAMRFSP